MSGAGGGGGGGGGGGDALPPEWAFTIHEAMQKTAEIVLRARTNLLGGEEEELSSFTPTLPPNRSHSTGMAGGMSRKFRLNLEVEVRF